MVAMGEKTGLSTEASLDSLARCGRALRVAVVMGNDVARWGLKAMFEALPSVRAVAGCHDAEQLIEFVADRDCDVVVVCADGEPGGRKPLRSLTAAKLLVLLRGADESDVAQAVSFDADGYLLETDLTPHALDKALGELERGGMPLPTSLARELLAQLRRRSTGGKGNRPFLLTAREHQALQLLADGLSNKQIAHQLGISEHGAKRHVANVLAKLNCPNRTLAVALAIRDGLLASS